MTKKRRKAAADRREDMIRVLVTAKERVAMEKAAKESGLSLSTWMRLIAKRAIARPAGPAPIMAEPDPAERH